MEKMVSMEKVDLNCGGIFEFIEEVDLSFRDRISEL